MADLFKNFVQTGKELLQSDTVAGNTAKAIVKESDNIKNFVAPNAKQFGADVVNTAKTVADQGITVLPKAIEDNFTKANVFDTYTPETEHVINSKYLVNKTEKSDLDYLSQNSSNIELWTLEESNKKVYDTAYGTRSIGRDALEGVDPTDRFVLYDKSSGKIMKYKTEDDTTRPYREVYERYDNAAKLRQSQLQISMATYDAKLTSIRKQIDATTDYATKNNLWAQYNAISTAASADYTKQVEDYKKIYNVYTEAKNYYDATGTVAPNSGYMSAMNRWYDESQSAKKQYESIYNNIVDPMNPTQVNSASDVIIRSATHAYVSAIQKLYAMFGTTGTGPTAMFTPDEIAQLADRYKTQSFLKDFNEFADKNIFGNTMRDILYLSYDVTHGKFKEGLEGFYKEYPGSKLVDSGEITASKAAFINGINVLAGLGEDLDKLGASEVKAYLNSPGMSGQDAIKAMLGMNVNYDGMLNFDWDTGSNVLNFALEMASDPSTWLSLGTKGAVEGSIKTALKASDFAELGIEVTDKDIAMLAKQVANKTIREGLDVDTGLKQAIDTYLMKERLLVDLSHVEGVDYDTLRRSLNKIVNPGGDYNISAVRETLRKTQMTDNAIAKVLNTIKGSAQTTLQESNLFVDSMSNLAGYRAAGMFAKVNDVNEAIQHLGITMGSSGLNVVFKGAANAIHSVSELSLKSKLVRYVSRLLEKHTPDVEAFAEAVDKETEVFERSFLGLEDSGFQKISQLADDQQTAIYTGYTNNLLHTLLNYAHENKIGMDEAVQVVTENKYDSLYELYSAYKRTGVYNKLPYGVRAQLDNALKASTAAGDITIGEQFTKTLGDTIRLKEQYATLEKAKAALTVSGYKSLVLDNDNTFRTALDAISKLIFENGTVSPILSEKLSNATTVLSRLANRGIAYTSDIDNAMIILEKAINDLSDSAEVNAKKFMPTYAMHRPSYLTDTSVDEALITSVSKHVKTASQIATEVYRKYTGNDLSSEMIQNIVENDIETAIANNPRDKFYGMDLLQNVKREIIINSNNVESASKLILGTDGPTALSIFADSVQNESVKRLQRQFASWQSEKTLRGYLDGLTLSNDLKEGIRDTLSDSAQQINNSVNRILAANTSALYGNAKVVLKDKLINDSIDYLNKSRNCYHDYSSMIRYNAVGKINYNSANPAEALADLFDGLNNSADDYFKTARTRIAVDADKYNDVYISVGRNSDSAIPTRFSFMLPDGSQSSFATADQFIGTAPTANKLYGSSMETVQADIDRFINDKATAVYADQDTFNNAVKEYLNTQSRIAGESGKQIRVIMHNAGADTTDNLAVLNRYMYRNNMETYFPEVVDVAKYVREDKGFVSLANSDVAQLDDLIERMCLESNTNKSMYNNGSILLNNPEDLYKNATEVLFEAQSGALKNIVSAETMKGFTDLYGYLDNVRLLKDAMIKDQKQVIASNVLEDYINSSLPAGVKLNITAELFADEANVNTAIRAWDYYRIKEWVSESEFNELSKAVAEETITSKAAMQAVSDYERLLNSIVNYAYLGDMRSQYNDIVNMLGRFLRKYGQDSVFFTVNNFDKALSGKLVHEKGYVAFYKYFTEHFDERGYAQFLEANKDSKNVIAPVQEAYNKFHALEDYAFGRNNFSATLPLSKETALYATDSALKSIDHVTMQANEFIRKLEAISNFKATQIDPAAPNQIHMLNKLTLTDKIAEYVKQMESAKADAYYSATMDSEGLDRFDKVRYAANTALKYARDAADYQEVYDSTRLMKLFSLSPEHLEAYVVRNCANALIIQPSSALITESKRNLEAFVKFMDSLDDTKFAATNLEDGGFLIQSRRAIALSTTGTEYGKFLKEMDNIESNIAYSVLEDMPKDLVNAKMHDMFSEIAINLPGRYVMSSMNTFTQDAYNAVAGVADGLVSKELINKMGWFDNTFSNNVFGDVDYVKKFYPYSSSNIVNNAFNGLNLVSSGYEYIQNVANIAQSPHVRFRTIVGSALGLDKDVLQNSANDLQRAVEQARWEVCKFDYKVINGKKTPVSLLGVRVTKSNILNLLDDPEIMMLDSSLHTTVGAMVKADNRARAVANVAAIINKGGVAGKTVKYYKVFEKFLGELQRIQFYAWLFTKPGTWINNGFDSNYKAFISTQSLDFVKNRGKYIEMLNRYEDIRGHLIVDANNMDLARIHAWYTSPEAARLFGDINEYLPEKDFVKLYAINTHQSGSLVQDIVENIHSNQASKLARQMGVPDEEAYALALKEHEPELSKLWAKHTNIMGEIDWAALQKDVYHYIDTTDLEHKFELKSVILRYVPETKSFADKISNIPVAGKYFGFNQEMFGRIEQHSRTALAMYFMDYYGDSPSVAIERMLDTQFDYSNRTGVAEKINTFVPFSTFKIMNAKYWLGAVQNDVLAANLITNTFSTIMQPDPWELAKSYYWQQQLQKEDDKRSTAGFASSMMGDLLQVYESNSIYTAMKGNIDFMGINVKLNTTFMDAMNIYAQIAQTIATGDIKSFLADQVYSPLVTLSSFFENLITQYSTKDEWLSDNLYSVIDALPLVGTITNGLLAKARQGLLNAADLKLAFATQSTTLFELIGAALTTGVSSILSTTKTAKPVGVDWYNQTDEYKATHQFIYGVSVVPTFVEKDPARYVDNIGILISMGYTKTEALELLNTGWHFDKDGKAHQYNLYDDAAMPNLFKYNQDVFDNTLKYFLGRGYSFQDAYALMQKGCIWVDDSGVTRTDTDVKALLDSSEFYREYKGLADYIKNVPNQYSLQLKYYRENFEMDAMTARLYMADNALFIDGDGNPIELDAIDMDYLNKLYATKSAEKKPTTATSYGTAAGYEYSDTFHIKKVYYDSYKGSLKSAYPDEYRNIVWSQRRDIYKDQYLPNGAPIRKMLKSTRYYNNSTMRFKQQWRHNRFDYIRNGSDANFTRILRGY